MHVTWQKGKRHYIIRGDDIGPSIAGDDLHFLFFCPTLFSFPKLNWCWRSFKHNHRAQHFFLKKYFKISIEQTTSEIDSFNNIIYRMKNNINNCRPWPCGHFIYMHAFRSLVVRRPAQTTSDSFSFQAKNTYLLSFTVEAPTFSFFSFLFLE